MGLVGVGWGGVGHVEVGWVEWGWGLSCKGEVGPPFGRHAALRLFHYFSLNLLIFSLLYTTAVSGDTSVYVTSNSQPCLIWPKDMRNFCDEFGG